MLPSEGNFQQQFFVVVVVLDNLFYFIKRIESGHCASITILNGHEHLQLARAKRSCASLLRNPRMFQFTGMKADLYLDTMWGIGG